MLLRRLHCKIEQAGKAGGSLGSHSAAQGQIAAGPQPGGGFQSTVAEETEHHFPGARQGKHLPQAQCLRGGFFGAALRATRLPQGQAVTSLIRRSRAVLNASSV